MRLLRRIKIYAAVTEFIAVRRQITTAIEDLAEALNQCEAGWTGPRSTKETHQ